MSNYYSAGSFTDLIRAEIDSIQGPKRTNPRFTFISCPYHNEKTPSARIWHDNGRFQCFGCGEKVDWNTLAATLHLKQIGGEAKKLETQSVPTTNLERYDDGLLATEEKEDLALYDLDHEKAREAARMKSGKWRGFDFEFLEKVGVKLAQNRETGRFYMYLPVTIKGRLKGYIKAQLTKPRSKEVPSYINSKGSWSRVSGLFGYDYALQLMKENGWSTIVLVEGPRDALRLLSLGIPAMCIMGTQSWGPKKFRFLEFSGARRIVLMFDGDAAGKIATRLVKTGLNVKKEKVAEPLESVFDVKVVRLWLLEVAEDHNDSKYDPGNCPLEVLDKVKKLIK